MPCVTGWDARISPSMGVHVLSSRPCRTDRGIKLWPKPAQAKAMQPAVHYTAALAHTPCSIA